MYQGQPSVQSNTAWILDGHTGQHYYFDYATNEIVTEHGLRYHRPLVNYQSSENAAPSFPVFNREPRVFPTPPVSYPQPSTLHTPHNTSYTFRQSPQERPSAGPPSHLAIGAVYPASPTLPISPLQRLSFGEQGNGEHQWNETRNRSALDKGVDPSQQADVQKPAPRSHQLLHESFKKPKYPKKFFRLGKVFDHLHTESCDERSVVSGSQAWTKNSYGEFMHSKPRKFVLVKEGALSCIALPVTTYSYHGVAKPGVKKSDHAIIYTGRVPPEPSSDELLNTANDEADMQPNHIRVDTDERGEKLDPMSRVNFAKPTTIEHNWKVKSYGMVNRNSIQDLVTQFRYVLLEDSSKPSRRTVFRDFSQANTAGSHSVQKSQYDRAFRDLTRSGWAQDDILSFLKPNRLLLIDGSSDQPSIEIVAAEGDGSGEELGDVEQEGDIEDADDVQEVGGPHLRPERRQSS